MAKKSFLERLGIIEPISANDSEEMHIDREDSNGYIDLEYTEYNSEPAVEFEEEFQEEEFEEEEFIDDINDYGDDSSIVEKSSPIVSGSDAQPMDTSESALQSEFDKLLNELDDEDDNAAQVSAPQSTPVQQDDYKSIGYGDNVLLSIGDIYGRFGIEYTQNRNIFVAETYEKALPQDLPYKLKRDTVLSILSVSNIAVDELVKDAMDRIDSLNETLVNFENATRRIIESNDKSIEELERRIQEVKANSQKRVEFSEDQTSLIKYEIQKVYDIMEFIKPNN